LEVDPTVERHGGGAFEGTVDPDFTACDGDVPATGFDEAALLDEARGIAATGREDRADVDIEAAQAGIVRGVGGDADRPPDFASFVGLLIVAPLWTMTSP
jgi:hypothetical protein